MEELGRNFYANESHIGKATRAEASITQLKELNSNVNVNISEKDDVAWMYLFFYKVLKILNVCLFQIIMIRNI